MFRSQFTVVLLALAALPAASAKKFTPSRREHVKIRSAADAVAKSYIVTLCEASNQEEDALVGYIKQTDEDELKPTWHSKVQIEIRPQRANTRFRVVLKDTTPEAVHDLATLASVCGVDENGRVKAYARPPAARPPTSTPTPPPLSSRKLPRLSSTTCLDDCFASCTAQCNDWPDYGSSSNCEASCINLVHANFSEAECMSAASGSSYGCGYTVCHAFEVEGCAYAHSYSWGTDRVDQPNLPLDHIYNPPAGRTGTGVDVYVSLRFFASLRNHSNFVARRSLALLRIHRNPN